MQPERVFEVVTVEVGRRAQAGQPEEWCRAHQAWVEWFRAACASRADVLAAIGSYLGEFRPGPEAMLRVLFTDENGRAYDVVARLAPRYVVRRWSEPDEGGEEVPEAQASFDESSAEALKAWR